MEFSIYRLDYISSVYIHTHVGLVSAVPGALVTTRPCEDRAYNTDTDDARDDPPHLVLSFESVPVSVRL